MIEFYAMRLNAGSFLTQGNKTIVEEGLDKAKCFLSLLPAAELVLVRKEDFSDGVVSWVDNFYVQHLAWRNRSM